MTLEYMARCRSQKVDKTKDHSENDEYREKLKYTNIYLLFEIHYFKY